MLGYLDARIFGCLDLISIGGPEDPLDAWSVWVLLLWMLGALQTLVIWMQGCKGVSWRSQRFRNLTEKAIT